MAGRNEKNLNQLQNETNKKLRELNKTVCCLVKTVGNIDPNQQVEIDFNKMNWLPICVDGVQWYSADISIFDNVTAVESTPTKIYKQGVLGVITATAPTGVIVEGVCNLTTQRIHENFVVTGTSPLVIPAGIISISVTKTNDTGIVNINGDNGTNFPLTFNRENFTDSVNEAVSTLSAYTITGTAAETTYKVHIIK